MGVTERSGPQLWFRKWLKDKRKVLVVDKRNWVLEYKICKKKSMPFSEVKEHQEHGLKDAKINGFYYKLPDSTYGIKPFDAIFFIADEAYLVIAFYEPRKTKVMYMIEIDDWLLMKKTVSRKSLTPFMAEAICYKKISL